MSSVPVESTILSSLAHSPQRRSRCNRGTSSKATISGAVQQAPRNGGRNTFWAGHPSLIERSDFEPEQIYHHLNYLLFHFIVKNCCFIELMLYIQLHSNIDINVVIALQHNVNY